MLKRLRRQIHDERSLLDRQNDEAAETKQGEWARLYMSPTGLRWRCCLSEFEDGHADHCELYGPMWRANP